MTAARRPGRPARLSLERILDVASEMEIERITLTSVAERLGAARNAVAYHAGSRDELLALVVERRLAARLASLEIPLDNWRTAIRTASHGMLDALQAEGPLALGVTRAPFPGVLGPSEDLLHALTLAGFSTREAGRILGLVAEIVHAAARNSLTDGTAGSTTPTRLDAVVDATAHLYPTLAAAVGQRWTPREQLDFSLDVIVLGLERLMDSGTADKAAASRVL